MSDDFYTLSRITAKKVQDVLLWANTNGTQTVVDMLDCSKSFIRAKADKTFEEVVKLVNRQAAGSFRIIHRKNFKVYEETLADYKIKDLIDVFIRSIDIGNVEYFIFIYVDTSKFYTMMNKFPLKRIN